MCASILTMRWVWSLAVDIPQGGFSCPLFPGRIRIWNVGFCGGGGGGGKRGGGGEKTEGGGWGGGGGGGGGEENWRAVRKTHGAWRRTKNKLNPHVTPGLGIKPGPRLTPHWWEVRVLIIVPYLPWFVKQSAIERLVFLWLVNECVSSISETKVCKCLYNPCLLVTEMISWQLSFFQ